MAELVVVDEELAAADDAETVDPAEAAAVDADEVPEVPEGNELEEAEALVDPLALAAA